MSSANVVIIETGLANIASVRAAFARCGATTHVSADADTVRKADYVVLPGVGAFGPGIERLRSRGLDQVLKQRVDADRPILAICLGLQLLAEASEESPGATGLAIVRTSVEKIASGARSPHFGWNKVTPEGPGSVEHGYAYFANSYRLGSAPQGWTRSHVEHGGPMIAAIERGKTLACQFHPELSGSWGLDLISRWLARSASALQGASPC